MPEWMQFRYCRKNLIEKCVNPEPSLSPEEVKLNNLKCSKGEYKIRLVNNKSKILTFRNKFCAECSGFSINESVCNKITPKKISSEYNCTIRDVTWSVLFDFNFFTGEYRVGFNKLRGQSIINMCDTNFFYDPFSKKCRLITSTDNLKKFLQLNACSENFLKTYQPEEFTFLNENNDEIKENQNKVFILSDTVILNSSFYKYDSLNGTIQACFKDEDTSPTEDTEKFSDSHNILTTLGISLSLIGLILLLIIYSLFPSLRNLPGKNLICFSISYLLVYLIVIISTIFVNFVSNKQTNNFDFIFYLLAVCLHYSFLSAFSWMTIISFDIYKTFIGKKSYTPSRDKQDEARKFKFNLLICFLGLPFLPVGLALTVDNFLHDLSIAPHYGGLRKNFRITWFSNRLGLLVFYVLPVALMILTNLIFFLFTVIAIIKTDKNIVSYHSAMKTNIFKRYRMVLFVKLLVLMGLSWSIAFMASLTDSDLVYLIHTVLNAFQGFFIFICFSFNKKVFALFKQKFFSQKHLTQIEIRLPNFNFKKFAPTYSNSRLIE